ncbi:hypothetical protein [Fibrella aquatilis]|uniref:Uncharacterized protein n=1 Tax=Fibrella aquatilis TaxID=2817059 RepID=A0A939GAT2_9BACT|nr:hypothetical protein [Fibrella aquatilis]MBO0933227.1 hypothetical protein [Fibrella aquatilis]
MMTVSNYQEHPLYYNDVNSRRLSINQLTETFSVTTTLVDGKRARKRITETVAHSNKFFFTENVPPFFRQQLRGETRMDVLKEFCQLATNPTKAMLRVKVDLSADVQLAAAEWHSIIDYCITSLGLAGSPAIVLHAPTATHCLHLFVLSHKPLKGEETVEHQRIVRRMMAIQLALWWHNPVYRNTVFKPTPHELANGHSQTSCGSFISRAIYDLLDHKQIETIYSLREHLWLMYQIKSYCRLDDYSFYELRFRHKQFSWINACDLSLDVGVIRIWLDFNRLVKQPQVRNRIMANIK